MAHLSLILKYLRHLFLSILSTKKPPFIKNLIKNVIKTEKTYYAFYEIESIRNELLRNDKIIAVKDFGRGTEKYSEERKINDIVKKSAVSAKYGQLLFKLVDHFAPETILELGTSLGISTMYLATARRQAKVITHEGCQETAKISSQLFDKLNLTNIEIVIGNFDCTLSKTLQKISKLNFVFIDGNHREIPTINYFEQCLTKISEPAVFIFDDIHSSNEMEKAWKYIKKHPKTGFTIDIFFLGMVFFYHPANGGGKKRHYYFFI